MKLVIIESTAKRQYLAKLLTDLYGSGVYKVIASLGHIRDLPHDELGVDVSNGFQPRYTTAKGKAKTIKLLGKHVSTADAVYLATDPDREGEAIAWHIIQVTRPRVPVFRVSFNEITKAAVKRAFDDPRQLNMDLVAAQEARRVLDRLVGYKVSPALWRGLDKAKLSAGRVQSVALGLVVARQQAIDNFQSRKYWSIRGTFAVPTGQFETTLILWAGQPWTNETFQSEAEAQDVIKVLSEVTYKIQKVDIKPRRNQPPAPFITSTLQQAASSHLQLSPDKTMSIAQTLYEAGLITYMRTDSPVVSEEAADGVERLICEWYGDLCLPEKRRKFKAKSGSQEAHECIRPTEITLAALDVDHDDYSARLYQLIWARFIASQMADAVYEVTTVLVVGGTALFMVRHERLMVDGFLTVYRYGDDVGAGEHHQQDADVVLPVVTVGQTCRALAFESRKHSIRPPPRYTEAALVKALETHGVGRPSTYSLMVTTIRQRKYVRLKQRQLQPTMLGGRVNRFLETHFALVVNVDFTKLMEDALDQIALGELETRQFLNVFWDKFYPLVQPWEHAAPASRIEPTFTGETCPVCGAGQIEIKRSRKGRFLSCNRYPQCKYSRNIQVPAPALVGRLCPQCGAQLCLRARRKGSEKFIGCTNYPACKHTESFQADQRAD